MISKAEVLRIVRRGLGSCETDGISAVGCGTVALPSHFFGFAAARSTSRFAMRKVEAPRRLSGQSYNQTANLAEQPDACGPASQPRYGEVHPSAVRIRPATALQCRLAGEGRTRACRFRPGSPRVRAPRRGGGSRMGGEEDLTTCRGIIPILPHHGHPMPVAYGDATVECRTLRSGYFANSR